MTIEADVFRLLRRDGPMKPQEIVRRLGHSTWGVRHAIYRLRDKGYIERTSKARYVVTKRVTPKDGRGQSDASRQNLLLALGREGGYAKARREAEARGDVYHPKPRARTALEQAWGFVPVSVVAAENEPCLNSAGTVRPQETEAA